MFYIALRLLFRTAYTLLYHSLAWSYDLVAGLVSFGQWNAWVRQIIPLVQGTKVLEIGFGPGHLQIELYQQGFSMFGIDESAQMVRQAKRRLSQAGFQGNLVRGLSQAIPFQPGFETVVATFPSEYIVDPRTLAEITRVLSPGGRLVVLFSVIPRSADSRWGIFRGWTEGIESEGSNRANPMYAKIMGACEKAGLHAEKLFIAGKYVTLIILQGVKD